MTRGALTIRAEEIVERLKVLKIKATWESINGLEIKIKIEIPDDYPPQDILSLGALLGVLEN